MLCLCVHACMHVLVDQCPSRLEEHLRFPRAGVMESVSSELCMLWTKCSSLEELASTFNHRDISPAPICFCHTGSGNTLASNLLYRRLALNSGSYPFLWTSNTENVEFTYSYFWFSTLSNTYILWLLITVSCCNLFFIAFIFLIIRAF